MTLAPTCSGVISAREGWPAWCLLREPLLDLDHFKNINDTYGHGPGDDVLAAVGEALRSAVRESDFPGRYGGEEFLILLPDTELKSALAVAEKIRLAIATIRVSTVGQLMTASIGVATLPGHGHDTQTLLRAVDRALYTAKANGRNLVETLQDETTPATLKDAAAAYMVDGSCSSSGRTEPKSGPRRR